jgi:Protein of unknown function (DUF2586)
MAQPKVIITQLNGGLGRQPANQDGVAALVISVGRAPDGLDLDTTAIVNTLEEAEALGISAAYDRETEAGGDEHRVWGRVRDFYREAGPGATLYLRLVSGSVTQTAMLGSTGAAYQVLRDAGGAVRLLAVARGTGSGTVTNGVDGDVYTAIAAAKSLLASEATQYRYASILVEGRQFSGTISNLTDLRASDGPNANRVAVVLGADKGELEGSLAIDANSPAGSINYAAVGLALGRLAKVQVHRNLGRVRDGEVQGVVTAAFSGGQLLSGFTEAQLDTLNDKGFLFLRRHSGLSGYYWNDDYTCAPNEDDFGSLSRGRTMDKASRIVRAQYVLNLLDNVEVDTASGTIATAVIKSYQAQAETAIEQQMVAAGELSGVRVTVDPNQNVLATDKIETEVQLIPTGLARQIVAKLAFENPVV